MNNNEIEIWKNIPGYDGIYQASTLGRIRSIDRKVWNYMKKGRVLKQINNGRYYNYVSLNGIKKYVHRLVAITFIDNPNNLREVNHKDLNKQNNRFENLEWVTSKENKIHYKQSKYFNEIKENKIKKTMSKTTRRILENKDNIFKLWKKGLSVDIISKELKLGRDFVSQVIELYKEFLIYV